MPSRPRIALLATTATVALCGSAGAQPATPQAGTRCRGVDLGFTTAAVTAHNMTCRRARTVIRSWRRKVDKGSGPAPAIVYTLGYRCRFGGDELLVRVSCKKGRKAANARWGD